VFWSGVSRGLLLSNWVATPSVLQLRTSFSVCLRQHLSCFLLLSRLTGTSTGSLLRLFSSVFGVATPTFCHGLSSSSRIRQLTPHRKKRSAGRENDLALAPLNSGFPVHVRSFTMVMASLGAEMEGRQLLLLPPWERPDKLVNGI
jgi:hypothetical protein